MKNVFKILIISLFFGACQQQFKPEDVAKINGYWEIESIMELSHSSGRVPGSFRYKHEAFLHLWKGKLRPRTEREPIAGQSCIT